MIGTNRPARRLAVTVLATAGDLAFAHLHPAGAPHGDHGGPTLDFRADLPEGGNWWLFLQFRTAGILHTAALTLAAS